MLTGQQGNRHAHFDKYEVIWIIIEIHARSRGSIDERAIYSSKPTQREIQTGNIIGAGTKHVFNKFLMSFRSAEWGGDYRLRD